MKSNLLKLVLRACAYILIFCTLLTLITLVFLPKWDYEETQSGQVAGFYREPDNTLDVLYLGSCNMYSSVSPVLIYEKYGITGYAMCCPDEEMSTSYYYLREALKHQDIKVVVIESLFLTLSNGKKREHYNRFAVDYLPPSLNKIKLAWNISSRESALMKEYDPTAPNTLLTFAGYMFPLLRYHSRNDMKGEDFSNPFVGRKYNYYKGGYPQYNYTTNDGLFWDKVFNNPEVNEMSRKYVPMIKRLCEENGISMLIIKSPNYSRWGYDDKQTKIVRDYAAELGVPFIDFHLPENCNFEEWDYGYETGRLNVFGVKKLSETLGRYLTEDFGLQPTKLSEKDKAAWDECVDWYYKKAEEKGCSITKGRISQICNRDGAIRLRWNPCSDSKTYSVYRAEGKDVVFKLLTREAEGDFYLDEDVIPGKGYSYYVTPNEGELAGQSSQVAYYVYLDMPKDFHVENNNGRMQLTWEKNDDEVSYRIQRRTADVFNFEYYDSTSNSRYLNSTVSQGALYYYRLSATYKEDGNTYYSMTTIARGMPQKDPVIYEVSSDEGKAIIKWETLENQEKIRVLRRSEYEDEFTRIDTMEGDAVQYTDENVETGTQYFYKLVSVKDSYDFHGVSNDSNTVGVRVAE